MIKSLSNVTLHGNCSGILFQDSSDIVVYIHIAARENFVPNGPPFVMINSSTKLTHRKPDGIHIKLVDFDIRWQTSTKLLAAGL